MSLCGVVGLGSQPITWQSSHRWPPRMTAQTLCAAVTTTSNAISLQSALESPVIAFAYRQAAKKVHSVAASLPKDFRIVRRRPEMLRAGLL
jgi:hypothetical protein